MERGELESIRTPESQETPEPRNLRRVQVEGRVGLHSLCQGGCGFRGLSSKPWDLIPTGPGHGTAPGAGHVECATLGTEAFAFQNWLVNLCIVFRVWEFYFTQQSVVSPNLNCYVFFPLQCLYFSFKDSF